MTAIQRAIPRVLEEVAKCGSLNDTDIANILDVSKATVSRWRADDIKPQPRSKLALFHLQYVATRLGDDYSSEEIRT